MPAAVSKFVLEFLDNTVVPPMQFASVDVDTVAIVIIVVSLDVHKAAGGDPQFLKASPYMVRLITILINKCMYCQFFSTWSVEASCCDSCA